MVIAHVRGSNKHQTVNLKQPVTGRFVSVYLNGIGALQLFRVDVCAASPIPRKSINYDTFSLQIVIFGFPKTKFWQRWQIG